MLELFTYFWRQTHHFSQLMEGCPSYKKRAVYAMLEGLSKTLMYLVA